MVSDGWLCSCCTQLIREQNHPPIGGTRVDCGRTLLGLHATALPCVLCVCVKTCTVFAWMEDGKIMGKIAMYVLAMYR
jgi:hypothetical protein